VTALRKTDSVDWDVGEAGEAGEWTFGEGGSDPGFIGVEY